MGEVAEEATVPFWLADPAPTLCCWLAPGGLRRCSVLGVRRLSLVRRRDIGVARGVLDTLGELLPRCFASNAAAGGVVAVVVWSTSCGDAALAVENNTFGFFPVFIASPIFTGEGEEEEEARAAAALTSAVVRPPADDFSYCSSTV